MLSKNGHLPFAGLRIVDFSRVLAGPTLGKWLSVLGAETVRVESQRKLDQFRLNPPHLGGQPGIERGGGFHTFNYGKLSCTVDLRHPHGVALAKRLVAVSDVVVENFAPGTFEAFGLGYEELKSIKPDIIMLSISALGGTGPERSHVGYGTVIHGWTGIVSVTGYKGGSPQNVGGTYVDPLSGVVGVLAVLAALRSRALTGKGQHIDIGMGEVGASELPEMLMDYAMNGRVAEPAGNDDPPYAPSNCYRCRGEDVWIGISVRTDQEWQQLCTVLDCQELSQDPRFREEASRFHYREQLDQELQRHVKDWDAWQLMHRLQAAGVPAGVALTTADFMDDPHVRARDLLVTIDHPVAGKKQHIGLPWRVEPAEGRRYRPAPLLGQHNDYVFQEILGLPPQEVKDLVQEGAIH